MSQSILGQAVITESAQVPAVSVEESVVSGYLVNTANNKIMRDESSLSIYSPLSFPANALTSGTSFSDTILTSDSTIHFFDKIWIELTITYTNVSATDIAYVVPSPFLIQRLEFFFGSNLLQTFYNYDLHTYMMVSYNNEEFSNLNLQNYATGNYLYAPNDDNATAGLNYDCQTYGTNPGGFGPSNGVTLTRRFIIALPPTCFNSIFIPTVNGGQLKLRTYFSSGSQIYDTSLPNAASTGLALTSMRIYSTGYRLNQSVFNEVYNLYASSKIINRFSYSRQVQNAVTLNSGSEFSTPLTGILGTFSCLYFWVPAGSTGENQYTTIPLNNWSLISSSGQPYYSSTNLAQYIFSSMIGAAKLRSGSGSTNNGQMGIFNFSHAPIESLNSGSASGQTFMDGLARLRGVPNTITPGVYNINIVGQELAIILQESGNLVALFL